MTEGPVFVVSIILLRLPVHQAHVHHFELSFAQIQYVFDIYLWNMFLVYEICRIEGKSHIFYHIVDIRRKGSQSPILRFNPHMNGLLELFGEKSINHAHSSFSHRLKIVLHFVDSIDLILSNAIFQSESHTQKSLTYWMGSKEFNIN